MSRKVLAVIMGGGRGSRLYPLTRGRCKPAVPLAGKYRLVDVPISNCLNSGLNRIYLLTQFNTASLHRHVQDTYKFDPFGGGFVDILAAEQTEQDSNWYQGTADAVRQNMHHFSEVEFDYMLILSGDQLYRMDFNELIKQHVEMGAEVTIAAKATPSGQVAGLGLMRVDGKRWITEFVEKPTEPGLIESLEIPEVLQATLPDCHGDRYCLASMGIYLFNRDVLVRALDNEMKDFGGEIIPGLLGRAKMASFIFGGYWVDIGTVASFFLANLSMAKDMPLFNFFEADNPIYTHARYLPASKITRCTIDHAVVADGCIIEDARLDQCVIGLRSIIRSGTTLTRTIMMGGQYFETPAKLKAAQKRGVPPMGVGENCRIENAIIDMNARIGNTVTLSPEGQSGNTEGKGYYIRDGVIIVLKGAVIPDNTVI